MYISTCLLQGAAGDFLESISIVRALHKLQTSLPGHIFTTE